MTCDVQVVAGINYFVKISTIICAGTRSNVNELLTLKLNNVLIPKFLTLVFQVQVSAVCQSLHFDLRRKWMQMLDAGPVRAIQENKRISDRWSF